MSSGKRRCGLYLSECFEREVRVGPSNGVSTLEMGAAASDNFCHFLKETIQQARPL